MTKFLLKVTLIFTLFFALTAERSAQAQAPTKAKNLILMVGDGMGFNSDIAGTYYRFGTAQSQRYHKFRLLASATFSIKAADFDEEKEIGYDPKVFWSGLCGGQGINDRTATTDSAASGTALNWGRKTFNSRIGTDFNGKPVKLFGDIAAEAGLAVGAVSSVQIANATPAAVKAHQFTRGQLKEISREQILDQSGLTVLMGSGHPIYTDGIKNDQPIERLDYSNVGGRWVWEAMSADNGFAGVKFIDEKEKFEELAAKTPDKNEDFPARLVGVVRSTGDMFPTDGNPDGDEANALFTQRLGGKEQAIKSSLPTLSDMSLAALNILSRNENGFYLMIEGGAIDHGNHANHAEVTVTEHCAFAKSIDTVIDWVEKYSSWDETLLIITADHETGQLWGEKTYDDANNNNRPDEGEAFNGFQHVVNNGRGVLPGVQYATGGHSNALVPVWIHGAGAENVDTFIRGQDAQAAEFYAADGYSFDGAYIYNSDIPKIFKAASGLGEKK